MPDVTYIDTVRNKRIDLTPDLIHELIDPENRVTRSQAAAALSVSIATLERWAMVGTPRLRYYRLGKKAYYLKSDLAEFIDRQARASGAGG